MLLRLSIHVLLISIMWNEILGKILKNRLQSNDTYTFSRRNDHSTNDEYVPLNSITLNLLYNKNNANPNLEYEQSSHWFKKKKKVQNTYHNTDDLSILNPSVSNPVPSNSGNKITAQTTTLYQVCIIIRMRMTVNHG